MNRKDVITMYRPKTVNAYYYYKSLASDDRLSIKLPTALHNDAKEKAKEEGLTLSCVIKNLLIDYIDCK